jgi:hypothetical protein
VKIFVSHGSHDTWIARQMARCIGECGADVSIDTYDLLTGDDVRATLARLLGQVTELVVLFTPHSLDRAWVWAEVGTVLFTGRRVVPIFHGMMRADLGTGGLGLLDGLKDLQLNDFDRYLAEIRQRVAHEQSA